MPFYCSYLYYFSYFITPFMYITFLQYALHFPTSYAMHSIPLLDFLFSEGTHSRAVDGATGNGDSVKKSKHRVRTTTEKVTPKIPELILNMTMLSHDVPHMLIFINTNNNCATIFISFIQLCITVTNIQCSETPNIFCACVSNIQTYPASIKLISLHHHLELLIYLAIFCFCTWCELVIRVRLWAIWATCTIFMFLLIQSLQL